MLFGPHGFREAPENHRLVLVMGSSPEEYFRALDTAIGEIPQILAERKRSNLNNLLFDALSKTRDEHRQLNELAKDVDADLALKTESMGEIH